MESSTTTTQFIKPPWAIVDFQTLLLRELESNSDAIRLVQEPERKCPYCKHMVETKTFLEHKMHCKEGLIKFPKPKKSQLQCECKKAKSEKSNWRRIHEEFQIMCKQERGLLPMPEYTGPRKEKHPSSITLKSIKIEDNCDNLGTVKIEPIESGLINDTYLVELSNTNTNNTSLKYILQRKNHKIFKNIQLMMNNIEKVSQHLREKIIKLGGNPERETLSIIPTIADGKLFYKLIIPNNDDHNNKQDDEENSSQYWTMFKFIENTITHEKADSEELAFEGGKMIGKFQNMLSDLISSSSSSSNIDQGNVITYENRECIIKDVLPGFHNIRFRFEQFDQALERNIAKRLEEVSEEIGMMEKYRKEMIDFWKLVETNKIPLRITHNDTKLSNILFDSETNKACCLIDLDTIMCSTVLNDFGDAIRSYCNTSTEDDPNTQNIHLKMDIFESFTSGYLSESCKFLTPIEIEYLAFSAKYITFEQALRFLTDYINGDTYYKISYPQHNLIRTKAQLALLHSIESNFKSMNEIVHHHYQQHYNTNCNC